MGLLSIFSTKARKEASAGYGQEFEERFRMYLRMIRMTESQIPHQAEHSERVTEYTRLICERLDLGEREKDEIVRAAQLHDIGKVAMSGLVLGAEGSLTSHQVAELRRHPVKGAELLHALPHFEGIVQGVLYHHERWNGSGYPEGLSGEKIPFVARVIGVADVFDALTSQRAYRKAYAVESALEHFRENSGKLYDPTIIDALLEQWSNSPVKVGQDWSDDYTDDAVSTTTTVTADRTAESA